MHVKMKGTQRDDLNSLRGIAVLSVVLFHLNTKYFSNGHFGVDIFFVLSGYFIFTIHCLSHDRPLYEFFSKRIWRIIPGYFAFLTVTTISAYKLLTPNDFVYFVEELKKACCFVSNLKFGAEKGYFETVAEHYFLLHTWSLSAEIQFYICSAFIALLLKKTGDYFVILLIIASIGCRPFVSANFAFYSLFCRLWQFLFGYLAVKMQSKLCSQIAQSYIYDFRSLNKGTLSDFKKRNSLFGDKERKVEKIIIQKKEAFQLTSSKRVDHLKTTCIFLLILICLVSGYHELLFAQRLLVNILACYIITSKSEEFSRIDLLWNNGLFQYFGKVSYSWYLWHWPLSVLFTYREADILKPINLLTYTIVPLVLATLSTYAFERPLQRIGFGKVVTLLVAFIPSLLFLFSSIAFLTMRFDIVDHFQDFSLASNAMQFNPKEPAASKLYLQLKPCYDQSLKEHCVLGDVNATDHTVIYGDSHAMSVFIGHTYLRHVLDNSSKVSFIGQAGCIPYGSSSNCKYAVNFLGCFGFVKVALDKLRTMLMNRVIVVARYYQTYGQIMAGEQTHEKTKPVLQKCIRSVVREFENMTQVKEIILLHQIPFPDRGDVPTAIERALKVGSNLTNLHIKREKHDHDFADLHEEMENVKAGCPKCSLLLDPATVMCDNVTCPVYWATQNAVIHSFYQDDQHVNDFGTRKLSHLFERRNSA